MPTAPLSRCKARVFPPCQIRVKKGYCAGHTKKRPDKAPRKPDTRISASARGYNVRWRKARLWFLKRNPLCIKFVICNNPATVVDHIIPHRGDSAIFWDKENWQSMCEGCHNRKTATEDRLSR